MRFKIFAGFVFVFFVLCFATNSPGVDDESLKSPSAFLPAEEFEFEPVIDGVEIRHDFIIQNRGTAPLIIEKVKAGWGCTAVSNTRQIPAGGEGKITLNINTKGYGGRKLKESVTVYTNDEKRPNISLTVFGNVEEFADITPKRIRLIGPAGKDIRASVSIIPKEEYPFKTIEAKAKKGKHIRYELEKIKSSKGVEYLLTVINLKKEKGRYFDAIHLKTDSKVRAKPEIVIRVHGYISGNSGVKKNDDPQ